MGIPVCDDELLRTVEAYNRLGRNKVQASDALGINRSTLKSRLARAAHRGLIPPDGDMPAPGYIIKARSITTDADGNVTRQSVTHGREPGGPFGLPEGHMVKGISALTDADGNIVSQWIKTTLDRRGAAIDAIRDALAGDIPAAPDTPAPDGCNADLLTVYPIPDVHIGLMAWARESGADYDLAIARDIILSSVAELIRSTPPSRHAVILWLGDTTHQNDRTNMTPRSGHVLDTDGRFHKVLFTAAQIVASVTDMVAAHHERVSVRILEGNHDPEASLAISLAMSMRYEGHARIHVETSPSLHYYRRFGSVLIGATHGHTIKPKDMAMMLACDRPEDWGATKYRHFFFGHIHKTTSDEYGGVIVESFPSPAAKDSFAHGAGYRSQRSLTAVTFHAERGQSSRAYVYAGA